MVMLLFATIGFYYISLRFSEEVIAEWYNPRRVFGGGTRTFILISSGHTPSADIFCIPYCGGGPRRHHVGHQLFAIPFFSGTTQF